MSIAIETPIHFKRAKAGKKTVAVGPSPEQKSAPPDPVPRISRLMALAIHFDKLIREPAILPRTAAGSAEAPDTGE